MADEALDLGAVEFGACGDSVGGFPHGLAIHKRAFDGLFKLYRNHYLHHATSAAWLPIRWETRREGSALVANLSQMRLEIGPTLEDTLLVVTFAAGTFTSGGRPPRSTAGWTLKLKAPLELGSAAGPTADPYPPYAKAFARVDAQWHRVHQLAIRLDRIGRAPVAFAGAALEPEEQDALLEHVGLLTEGIRARDPFVLLYLGAYARDMADPWLMQLLHPFEFVATAQPGVDGGEIHLAYRALLCKGKGTGGFGRPVCDGGVEASLCLGRNAIFLLLSRKPGAAPRFSEGKVTGFGWRTHEAQVMFERAPGDTGAGLTCTFHCRMERTFTFEAAGAQHYQRITYLAIRRYDVALRLGDESDRIECEVTPRNRPGEPDRWLWTQDGETADVDPQTFADIVAGQISEATVKRFLSRHDCFGPGGALCGPALEGLAHLIARGHQVYRAVNEDREALLRPVQVGLGEDRLFAQLLPAFTYQKLRLDDDWNLRLDARFERPLPSDDPEPEEDE